MLGRHSIRNVSGALSLGLLIVTIGCGPNYKARAIVKGKVTYQGKHLTVGNVVFHGQQNLQGSATIDENGNYEMRDAPLGDVQVTIFVPKPPMGGLARMKSSPALKGDTKSVDPSGSGKSISIMGKLPDKIVSIPDKYASPSSSGLTYTVKSGEYTYDIELK